MKSTKKTSIELTAEELDDTELLKQRIISNLSCSYDLFKEFYADPEPLKNELSGYFTIGSLGFSVSYHTDRDKGEKQWYIFGGYGLKGYKSIAPLLKHIDKYRKTNENWIKERSKYKVVS